MKSPNLYPQLSKIDDALAGIFQPPERMRVSEYAERKRYVSPESGAKKGGRWRNIPMQVEPMDSVQEPDVQSTVLMWSSQTAGKTEIMNNIVGYYIEVEPSSQLVIQPTLDMAEAWSKERLAPMIRDTPTLSLLMDDGTRESSNTILSKKFAGGNLTVAGANSPASLASRPVRVNLFDEVDRFPESAGTEGDPVMLAEKRSDTFPDAVCLKTSTPTIKGHSRIEKDFNMSDKRLWFVRCPVCDAEQDLKWKQLRWPKGRPKEARVHCEACDSPWDPKARIDIVWVGRWKATAPFNGVRGYHLNGLYSVFPPKKGCATREHQMAAEFLKAKRIGTSDAMRVWTNTFLAEVYEDSAETKYSWEKLFDRREGYTRESVPEGVLFVTAGVDFQKDRAEVEFIGWGEGEESWGLGHHIIKGDPRQSALYDELETLLLQTFTRADRAPLRCEAAGFDTGYAAGQRMLYAWLRTRQGRHYYALKGSSQLDAEPVSKPRKSSVRAVNLLMVGTNRIKSYIYDRASIETPGNGYMHFSTSYSAEFFKQMLSEDSYSVMRSGVRTRVFKLPENSEEGGGSPRNEGLDVRVYNHAALYLRGIPSWDFLRKRLLARIPDERALEADYDRGAPPRAPREERATERPRREIRRTGRPGRRRSVNSFLGSIKTF